MKPNESNVCGLDLQRDNISLVQYSNKEEAVTLIALQPLAADTAADPWKVWQDQLESMKPQLKSFSREIVCGLPSEFSQIKHCLVDIDEKEWREAVEWDIAQQLVGARDDYAIDCEKEASLVPGAKSFLTVAYQKSLVDRTTGMLGTLKFNPRIIDLDLFALVNLLEANYPEKREDHSLIVHAESKTAKLLLAKNGGFVDFQVFECAEPESFIDTLAIKASAFLERSGAVGAQMYLAGARFTPAVRAEAVDTLKNVEVLDPFRRVACHVEIEGERLREYSTQLAVAVGLALRGKDQLL